MLWVCWNDRLPACAPVSNESIVLSYLSCESKVQLLSDLYVVCFYVKRGEYQSQALPLQVLASYGQEEHSSHGYPFGTWPGLGLFKHLLINWEGLKCLEKTEPGTPP